MKVKRSHGSLPHPEDVLAGRVRLRADQLFALIHQVNPTGEESPRERERYALKSRLQGLLLTRFGDEVEVLPDPANPDLVSLRHRSGLRDACHALLSQLPVEARSVARRRLDEGGEPEPPDAATAAPAEERSASGRDDEAESPADLLTRGREAVETYDYEEARRLLTLAVTHGAGAEAARALVELLVDVLADDEAALALEARLSHSELSDPAARGLLALAAARSRQTERARRLARSLQDPVAARVHTTLARGALEAGDLAAATEHLHDARRIDPTEPSLRSLEDDLARAREAARKPAEDDLLAIHAELLQASPAQEAISARVESAARELLRRWPESEPGRRVLREIEEARRRERALSLEHEGRAALHDGDPSRAVRLLTQALAEVPGQASVKALLDAARQDVEARNADAAVHAVVDALAGPDLPAALVAYAELDPALRSRARAGARDAPLGLLDEVLAANPTERARIVVDAALALEAAEVALGADDPRRALAILESSHRALARVPRASALTRSAGSRLAAIRAVAARAALERARVRLEADDLDGALAALHDVKKGDLDRKDLEELARVADAARQAQSAWRARLAVEALEAARRALRLAISTEPHAADELADADRDAAAPRQRLGLGADGRQLVLTDAYGRWLFVRIVDVARNEVVRRLSLKAPHAIGDYEATLVEGSRLTVLGARAGWVELDLETGEVLQSGSLRDALPEPCIVEGTALVPGSRLAWIDATVGPQRAPVALHVSLDAARAKSKLSSDTTPTIVPLGPDSLVILEEERRIRILEANGSPVTQGLLALPIDVGSAAPAPAGPGLLLVGPTSGEVLGFEASTDESLYVLRLVPGPSTDVGRKIALPEGRGFAEASIVTARAEETSVILNLGEGGHRAFILGPDLSLRPPVAVPEETALFSDAESNHAVAACWWGERFAAVPLGRETRWPDWGGDLSQRNVYVGTLLREGFQCRVRSSAASLALYASLMDVSGTALPARIDEIVGDATDGDELEALLSALEQLEPQGATRNLARRVEAALRKRFPDHPSLVTSAVLSAARDDRWDLVLQTMRGRPSGASDALPPHPRHLFAIALARAGEIGAALALVEEIAATDEKEDCRVEQLLDLLREIDAARPSATPLGRVVGALKSAVVASRAGDAARVILLLDRGLLWASEIVQGHALLAKAWLDSDAVTPRDLFRKRRALARLLDLLAKDARLRRDLPPLPGGLTEVDVAELANRARVFLDG